MKFRSPVYLNERSLSDIANAYGIDTREAVEVRERNARNRSGGGGVAIGPVRAEGDRSSEVETEETFTRSRSPISLLDEVLERAYKQDHIVVNAATPVSRNSLVEFDGDLRPSSATEFVDAISMALPMLPRLLADQTGTPAEVAMMQQVLTEIASPNNAALWELDHGQSDLPRVLVKVRSQHLWPDQSMDDMDGEHTILGLVDQIVGEANEFSLERHLLPGINRATRRAMSGSAMEDMLASVMAIPGANPAASTSLRIPGPLYVVSAIAVY